MVYTVTSHVTRYLTITCIKYFSQVGTDVKLMSMVKAVNTEAPIWYAQVNIIIYIVMLYIISSRLIAPIVL